MSVAVLCSQLCVVANNLRSNPSKVVNVFKKSTSLLSVNGLLNYKDKFHTCSTQNDLMEFFDEKENWGKREVLVGRSWKIEELRIKSNSDLHKLWYILLKEKNMLLTMEHECNQKYVSFPNPERIDKVEESMENLEKVVRERNRAYYELETGETGERPVGESVNCFGLPYRYKLSQHIVEKKYNKHFLEEYKLNNVTYDNEYVEDFLMRLDEKRRRVQGYNKWRRYKRVCEILRTFPNVDNEALSKEFPDVNIEKAKKDPLSRTHAENRY